MRRDLIVPTPGVLVVAALWQPALGDEKALGAVRAAFGQTDDETQPFEFRQTAYYEKEMGKGLRKAFLAISGLEERDSLDYHKLDAIMLENQHLAAPGSRLLNVDPMIVSMENIIVATSKNFPHRVYLENGVFADLQLIRRKSRFEAMPWTYGDYVEQIPFFERQHARLKELLGADAESLEPEATL